MPEGTRSRSHSELATAMLVGCPGWRATTAAPRLAPQRELATGRGSPWSAARTVPLLRSTMSAELMDKKNRSPTWNALRNKLEQWARERHVKPDLTICLAHATIRRLHGRRKLQMLLQEQLTTPLRL